METGEDPEEGARREVREELGLEVEVEGFFSLANEVIKDDQGQVKYHFILLDYLMRPLGNEITLNEESEEFRWFPVGEVERLDTTENTKIVAAKLVKVLQTGDQSLR